MEPKINGRRKGASGEREFCKWIEHLLVLSYTPKRNLEQVRSGGADVLGIGHFIFEVKRVERQNLPKWWRQVTAATKEYKKEVSLMSDIPTEAVYFEPIVVFRQNKQPWNILISAKHVGLKYGFVQLGKHETVEWLKKEYRAFLRGSATSIIIPANDQKRIEG